MALVRSVCSNRPFPIRWTFNCIHRQFSVVPDVASQESPNTDQEPDISTDKLKVFSASYINSVLLLGTVIGLKMFPMQSNPDRNWALLFLKTRLSKFTPVLDTHPTDDTLINDSSVTFRKVPLSSSNRVHVFSPKLVNGLRDIKPGERLLVSGFLSYYQSSKLDGKTNKQCCVTAQRIAHMGWSSDYQPDKSLEEVLET